MRIEKVHLVYFSPAGSTQKVVQKMAEEFSLPREEHDLTVSGRYSLPERFSGEELVILGVPVYSRTGSPHSVGAVCPAAGREYAGSAGCDVWKPPL